MKQALLVLLFHKLVTLQPAAVDISAEFVFKPSVEIAALTSDARLIVDVTETLGALEVPADVRGGHECGDNEEKNQDVSHAVSPPRCADDNSLPGGSSG